METKYNKLTAKYNVSAREYFYILRLAIYHIDGVKTDSSYEVAQYNKSDEVWDCAVKILKAMY